MLLHTHQPFFCKFHASQCPAPTNFDDRPLFKPGALYFFTILNSINTNILFFQNHSHYLLNDPHIYLGSASQTKIMFGCFTVQVKIWTARLSTLVIFIYWRLSQNHSHLFLNELIMEVQSIRVPQILYTRLLRFWTESFSFS